MVEVAPGCARDRVFQRAYLLYAGCFRARKVNEWGWAGGRVRSGPLTAPGVGADRRRAGGGEATGGGTPGRRRPPFFGGVGVTISRRGVLATAQILIEVRDERSPALPLGKLTLWAFSDLHRSPLPPVSSGAVVPASCLGKRAFCETGPRRAGEGAETGGICTIYPSHQSVYHLLKDAADK